MKVLLTGARGQLGQALQRHASARGLEVIASDLPELDIADLQAVRAAVRAAAPAVLVNCAAYNQVDQAERDWQSAYAVNGLGPRNLAIAAEELGAPLLHFGTDFVFDGASRTPYTIADLPRPLNRYGQSKLLGEQLVRDLCRRHYVVRLSWVCGQGPASFADKVLTWARGGGPLQVVDDQVSSPSYVEDLAPALLDLLRTGAYGLYHLCNDGACSRHAWACEILAAAGLDVEVRPVPSSQFPTPAARPAFSALDTFPIAQTLGGTLPDWRDATRRFVAARGDLP